MSESKEFLGKTLDAAIAEACSFYDCAREKLEIDIIEDAKTGIFGIVGARKARIRASLASLPDFMQKPRPEEKPERPARNERRREKNQEAPVAAPESVKAEKEKLTDPLLPEEAESSAGLLSEREGTPLLLSNRLLVP